MPDSITTRPRWTEARLHSMSPALYDIVARAALKAVHESKELSVADKERVSGLQRGVLSRHARGLAKSRIKEDTVLRVMTVAPVSVRKTIHDATSTILTPQPELADIFEMVASVNPTPGACAVVAASLFSTAVQAESKNIQVIAEGSTVHVNSRKKCLSSWEFYRDFKSASPGRVAFVGNAHKSYAFTGTTSFGPLPFSSVAIVAALKFIKSHAWPKS